MGFLGVLPLLLGNRSSRPASACLGKSPMLLPREDGTPYGPGLPPVAYAAQREQYRTMARDIDASVTTPARLPCTEGEVG